MGSLALSEPTKFGLSLPVGQELLWLMAWRAPEVNDSSPSLVFQHEGSVGPGPSKQAINKFRWKLEEGCWLSELGDFSVPFALGKDS